MEWLNYFGIAIILILIVPNIIYAFKNKNSFDNTKIKKIFIIFEQVGRYGCIGFMIFNIPFTYFNFWFDNALTVYLSVNGILCLLYLLFWSLCWKRNDLLKALSLSIIPSGIFLFSGIVLLNIPLMIFATAFAVSHVFISCKNVKDFDILHMKSKEKRVLPPWSEIVTEMYGKDLPKDRTDGFTLLEVIYSLDKAHRFLILKSDENTWSYSFEELVAFEEYELSFIDAEQYPAMWIPKDTGFKSVFDDIELLKRELKISPEYKRYFE